MQVHVLSLRFLRSWYRCPVNLAIQGAQYIFFALLIGVLIIQSVAVEDYNAKREAMSDSLRGCAQAFTRGKRLVLAVHCILRVLGSCQAPS